ncbi:MAG: molybdenum cofactor guanylyltransferase [Candidatus Aerophobetes bacterium]|nr:molybdenum cofactor guanylyltransferase [Candidatus Aerophobetes bacterium]
MTGIILGGGKSRRMKKEKALLEIGKKQAIELIIEKLKVVFDDVLIIGSSSFNYRFSGVRAREDMVSEKGPLGGIYTGLLISESKYNFICACDMPFLNVNLLRFIISEVDDTDIVIPVVKGFVEPLHAIYSKRCLPAIKSHLEAKDLKVKNFFPEVKCKYLPEDRITKYDPPLLSFSNLNTPQMLELAKQAYR